MRSPRKMTPSQPTEEKRGGKIPRGKWQLKDGLNGRIFFPLTDARIKRWIKEGRVQKDDKVWRTGFSKWKKVGEVDKFKQYFEDRETNHRNKKTRRD